MKFIQWTTPDDTTFFPAGRVTPNLPPGYYIPGHSPHGLFLQKKAIKNEDLIKFPDSNSDMVITEINKFWELRNKFMEGKIQHKRGILLYGPPGSGKTCTLRQVVENLITKQKGVVLEWPGADTLLESYEVIRAIHPDMPIVVLMEDVDSILEGYNSKALNLLDGVHEIDRILFLATTNHPEKLGSRVVNRPSRFDKRFMIGMPNAKAREMFIEGKGIKGDELKRWVEDTDGLSIAHLKELYVASKILGDPYEQAIGTIKEMKFVPSSKFFDETAPMSERQALKYNNYGDTKASVYAECKNSKGQLLCEGSGGRRGRGLGWGSVDSIAAAMPD